MNKFYLPIILSITLVGCQQKTEEKPFWVYIKADVQNVLYQNESDKQITSNIEQLISASKDVLNQDALDSVQNLHSMTINVIEYLDDFKQDMILINGGIDPEIGIPLNLERSISLNDQFYSNSKGTELKSKLDQYTQNLKQFGLSYSQISIEPKNVPQLKNDPGYHDNTFIELHFADRNIFEALSSIEFFKTSILLKESIAIGLIISRNKRHI